MSFIPVKELFNTKIYSLMEYLTPFLKLIYYPDIIVNQPLKVLLILGIINIKRNNSSASQTSNNCKFI